jgi:predicted RNA-binding protein YlqC (UPF0109 family)
VSPESLVEHLARSLVGRVDAVSVSSRDEGGALVVELRVDKADLGKVIGRNGQTARAIRTLLSAACAHAQRRCLLNIVED